MVGVPSSRGCEGCRKQKKKCDVASGSPCARCRRLKIPCLGLGQQRFRFEDENKKLVRSDKKAVASCRKGDASIKVDVQFALEDLAGMSDPPRSPSNDLTRLTSAFASHVDPSRDIRIQLPWNFGPFLEDVPKRLGSNLALDAASETLVAAYSRFCMGNTGPDKIVLVKYQRTISALRHCLSEPVEAHSSETLCAIMILLMIQALTGVSEKPWASHTAGVARILKSRGHTGPRDDFESKLLLSLRGPVIVEGLMSRRVCLSQQEWQDLVLNAGDGDSIDGQMMRNMAHLPDLLNRGHDALQSHPSSRSEIMDILNEVEALKKVSQPILDALRERVKNHRQSTSCEHTEGLHGFWRVMHAHYARSFALQLAIEIMLNSSLVALGSVKVDLAIETSKMSEEIVQLAEEVKGYRPLGALYMVFCLGLAWLGADNEGSKSQIPGLLLEHQRDTNGATSSICASGLDWIEKRFMLR